MAAGGGGRRGHVQEPLVAEELGHGEGIGGAARVGLSVSVSGVVASRGEDRVHRFHQRALGERRRSEESGRQA